MRMSGPCIPRGPTHKLPHLSIQPMRCRHIRNDILDSAQWTRCQLGVISEQHIYAPQSSTIEKHGVVDLRKAI